jgi:GNAT superfamily N-acetyltransferase
VRSWTRPDGRRFVLGDPDADLPDGELFAVVDEAEPGRLQAFERLGFRVHRRELTLVLPSELPRVPAPGGLRALRADEVEEERLRLLDDELRQDVPGTRAWRWPAEDFRQETYLTAHFDPAVYLVATDTAQDHIGICRVWIRPERPRLGFIGVRRSHRRNGVARWLIGEAFATLHAESVRSGRRSTRRTSRRGRCSTGSAAGPSGRRSSSSVPLPGVERGGDANPRHLHLQGVITAP